MSTQLQSRTLSLQLQYSIVPVSEKRTYDAKLAIIITGSGCSGTRAPGGARGAVHNHDASCCQFIAHFIPPRIILSLWNRRDTASSLQTSHAICNPSQHSPGNQWKTDPVRFQHQCPPQLRQPQDLANTRQHLAGSSSLLDALGNILHRHAGSSECLLPHTLDHSSSSTQ